MTGRCLVVLCAALGFLAAGLSTGVPVYYALAAGTGALICTALFSAFFTLATLQVRCACPVVRVRREENVSFFIRAKHLCPLSAYSLRARVRTAGDEDEIALPLTPFAWQETSCLVTCPHRGVYTLGVDLVTAEDLFGLFCFRKKVQDCSFTVEVAPRAVKTAVMELGAGDTGPEAPNRSTEDDASPSGIRSWRDGDELKKVHWKLTMRRQELMVRTYEESARPDFLILVDLAPIGALRSRAMSIEDAACEAAASAALTQLQQGDPVRMPLNCSRPVECSGQGPEDLPRFIDALTSVCFDCAYSFEQLLPVEMRRMQRTGGAVLITPRLTMRVADMAMQMRRSGLYVRLEWINESFAMDGGDVVARLSLAGVEVARRNPYEGIS